MKKHTMFAVLALAIMFAYASAHAQGMGGHGTATQQPGMQSPNNPNNPNNNPVDMGPTQQTQQQQQQMPQVSDSDLQNAVKTKLAAEPAFANVQVAVDKGKVTLDGTVNSKDDKKKAKKTVQSVAGVRGVKEHLTVSGKESPGSQNNGNNQKQMSNAGPGMAFLSSQDAAQGNASGNTAGSIAGNSQTSANPNSNAPQASAPEAGTMQQSGTSPNGMSGQLTLQKQIEMKIKNDRTLTDSSVNVNVSENAVNLTGTVGSNQAKMHAQQIAQSYAQNRKVNNNLVVSGAGNSDLNNGHSAMSNGATQGTPKGDSSQAPQTSSPDQTTPH